MGPPSNSRGSPIVDVHQLAFPSKACSACPLRSGCDIRGTGLQCKTIPILAGDIQPGSPEAALWVERLGHDLALSAQGQFASPRLPQAIPRLTRQKAARVAAQGLQWVAVALNEVLLQRQPRILPKSEFIKSTGLDPATSVMLVMTGEDEDLSALGDKREALTADVAAASYDLVLAPAFSVWDGHSGFHNRVQITYCDRYATAFANAGIPTIYPAVWYRRADMCDLARVVQANPSISAMWMDWQTVSHGKAWDRVLREFDELASLVPDVRFIIYGVGQSRRPDLWKRTSVACVISSGEFISGVRQNRELEAGRAARNQVHAFVAEPQKYRPG